MGRISQLEATAYHEAGHAVLAVHLAKAPKPRRVSIVADEDSFGSVLSYPKRLTDEAGDVHDIRMVFDMVRVLYAGVVAQKRLGMRRWRQGGGSGASDGGDIGRVVDLYSKCGWVTSPAQVALDRYLFLDTVELVDAKWTQIKAVAEELLREKTISGKRVRQVMFDALMTQGQPTKEKSR